MSTTQHNATRDIARTSASLTGLNSPLDGLAGTLQVAFAVLRPRLIHCRWVHRCLLLCGWRRCCRHHRHCHHKAILWRALSRLGRSLSWRAVALRLSALLTSPIHRQRSRLPRVSLRSSTRRRRRVELLTHTTWRRQPAAKRRKDRRCSCSWLARLQGNSD